MTEKDYELIANVFTKTLTLPRGQYVEAQSYDRGVHHTAIRMADALAADNPRFDRAHFLKACGLED